MTLSPSTAESPRLRYELVHPDCFDPYELYEHAGHSASNIEEVTTWMTWSPHDHPKEILEFVETVGEKYDANEGVEYAIYPWDGEDGADEFAGMCGLSVDWDHRRAELGVWLRKPFWGRGYSGERARTLVALAIDVLDLEVVRVSHALENDNSRRAIEKYIDSIGGRKDGVVRNDLVLGDEPQDAVWYSATAEEWRGATGGDYEASFEW